MSHRVAQRNIEPLIGRLVADEAFRAMFLREPAATLTRFIEWGYDLTLLPWTSDTCADAGSSD